MSDALSERLADLTLELCRMPSVTGGEKAICDWFERRLAPRFGPALRRVGNTVVAGRLDDPRPAIALFGHLDTVPAHPGDGPARRDGDRVVGLGSSDMKSGVAVMLALAEDLDLAKLPYNLISVFYDREEGPFDENGLGPTLAAFPQLAKAALAFCLESTDLELQVGCMGSLNARVTFRGKSSHAARPWQGDNALHKAGPFLTELGQRQRVRHEVQGFEFFEVISATLAKGGRARNIIPESFELNVNYRFAPGKSLEQAERELLALVAGRADVKFVDRSPAGRVCAENPYFKQFRAITGAPAASKQAWTDVGRLSAAGVDAVNFGPGLTTQAHQAGEHVPVANLGRAYQMLRAFLEAPAPTAS